VLLISPGHQRGVRAMPAQLPRSVARSPTMRASQYRAAVDDLFHEGKLLAWGVPATGVSFAPPPTCSIAPSASTTSLSAPRPSSVSRPTTVFRRATSGCCDSGLCWRGLTAMPRAYAPFRERYRDMARTLGFEGHMEWAEAMAWQRSFCTRTNTWVRSSSRCRPPSRRGIPHREVARLQRAGQGFTVTSHLGGWSHGG
jgi:hypothetical protein